MEGRRGPVTLGAYGDSGVKKVVKEKKTGFFRATG
jgi:hypothetical protein